MRKLIACLLTVALTLTACVPILAAETADKVSYYSDDEGYVNLYASLGTDAYGEVMLTVFEKGFDTSTFASLPDDETRESKVKFAGQAILQNGYANFKFRLADGTGYYPYLLTSQLNGYEETGSIAYLAADDTTVLEAINGMTSSDTLEIYLDANAQLVFGNNSFYSDSEPTEQLAICADIIAGGNYSSLAGVVKASQKGNLTRTLSTASDAQRIAILSAYGTVLDLDKPEYTVFAAADSAFRADVVSLMSGSEYTAAGFYEAVDLTSIKNTTNYTEVNPILTMLKNSTEVDLGDYFDLSDTSTVDDKLVGKSYTTGEQLKNAIADAISELPDDDGGSKGGISPSKKGSSVYVSPVITETAAGFTDLDGYDWAKPAIEVLAENGVLNGKAKNIFAPADTLSREELVKMLVCIFEIHDPNAKSNFDDLSGHWSDSYIASAQKYGLVKGISDSEFGAGRTITRQDMAVLCYRFMSAFSVRMDAYETGEFSDIGSVADYAKEAVTVLKNARVINGKDGGIFAPNDGCIRAEAAKVVYYIFAERNI
ncbi:MAG: S-layer homology domain-containing protein [Clostridia bacterium]|nr:S-layer homology domain-containing protein [Clostridia bacterium]